YFAFLKTPSAESLYSQAEKLMKTDSKEAREGPVAAFLQIYPTHEKVDQVQKWADQYDFEMRDRQMHNRRNSRLNLEPEEEEKLALAALKEEDEGKLGDAAKHWKALSE